MNNLSTLYFPDTRPDDRLARQLLCFFDSVHHYQPLGEGQGEAGGLWTPYSPVDLSDDDRSRFLQLLRDFNGHGAEYYSGYLSSLTQQPNWDRDEASVGALIANLLPASAPDKAIKEGKGLSRSLGQAILLLKLAEIVAAEELEMRQRLAAVARQEAELLKSLRGEDDEAASTSRPPEPAAHDLRPPVGMERLIAAWAQLFLQDAHKPWLVTTAQPEAAALVLETYGEMKKGESPLLLCGIPLPVPAAEGGQDRGNPSDREEAATAKEELAALFQELAAGTQQPDAAREGLDRATAGWSKAVAARPQSGGKLLRFYLLPGLPLIEVFRHLRGGKEAGIPDHRPLAHGIMAVLEG